MNFVVDIFAVDDLMEKYAVKAGKDIFASGRWRIGVVNIGHWIERTKLKRVSFTV